ncbi:hypothetical protein FOMPIDRAFT_60994 [Fomitopsis schrenkii]|uniref:PH domain-containing protein n=1 Tax=Fomitopsis schrenkii TaxID=2126942 RepID=S8DWK1_FOMSC|nr:hypothetical protein FOMPIDRAFT_60994 [Fomitopsis schrenkii]
MSGAYDVSSEIFSLYSRPPMTRASTCSQGTQSLITPMDEGLRYPSGKLKPARGQLPSSAEGVRVASTTPNEGYLSRESALQVIGEHTDSGPYGPYFSLSRSPPATPPSSGLSRRGTTKELIGRFESMSPTKSPSSYYQETPRVRPGAYQAVQKTNKRSPIRQSIRSFLSVFKKTSSRTSGERGDLLSVAEDVMTEPLRERVSSSRTSTSRARGHSSTFSVPQVNPARQSLSICKTPISPTAARHSGSVVHLCRSLASSPGIHPVWAHCTATLHSTHLLLTTETSGGNPSTNIITFCECADVRSLSTTELEANERAMLPTQDAQGRDGQIWKIFELLFEGRPRERFAVRSVGERAAWVSKIWYVVTSDVSYTILTYSFRDAILEAQEEWTEAASIAARRDRSIASAEATTPTVARSPTRAQHRTMALGEIQTKADAILDRLRQRDDAGPVLPVDLSDVLTRLDALRAEMKNVAKASGARSPTAPADLDKLNELHSKLDTLASVCQTLHDREPIQLASGGALEVPEWLEAFVNHGTSQTENVAAGIQMLCKELGLIMEPQEQGEDSEGQLPQRSLLADDLRKNAEARNALTTESVVGLIDRQRQDQERMLRSLGTGERSALCIRAQLTTI